MQCARVRLFVDELPPSSVSFRILAVECIFDGDHVCNILFWVAFFLYNATTMDNDSSRK